MRRIHRAAPRCRIGRRSRPCSRTVSDTSRFELAAIQRYYDRNTATFTAVGEGGDLGAIHRAVWGPGVTSRPQALRFVEDQIAAILRHDMAPDGTTHVVDLGCGVGASICYLASRLPVRATGITLSAAQAARAQARIEASRLAGRVSVLQGDYCDLPATLAPAHAAFAIESFVHAPDPRRFFDACAALILPGGMLAICDDFRRVSNEPAAERAIARFRRGWHVNTLLTRAELIDMAAASGLEHALTHELTPYLALHRLRDRALAIVTAPLQQLPWRMTRLDPWLGGAALRECLSRGWTSYDLVVFRRR